MKRCIYFCLGICLAFASCRSTRSAQSADKHSIVILYDNDVHCAIDGYQRMAGFRDAISDTAWCCLVSSGDFLQGGTAGAISRGQYIADIMRTMHYDAITLGNHEFDYGIQRMKQLVKHIQAPVTCLNLRNATTGKQEYASYVMKEMGGHKVAFVGAVTPATLYMESYSFYNKNEVQTHQLCEKNFYAEVQQAVDKARKAGAEYVIMLSHVGEDDNVTHVNSHDLVRATRGIDVVLDGHTHSVVPSVTIENCDNQPVLVTQTGTKFAHIGKLLIEGNGRISTQLVALKDVTQQNAEVKAATDKVKEAYDAMVNRHIGQSDVPLNILDERGKQGVRLKEVNVGDLVTDAYRHVTGAQIAITNGGGIRANLKAGELTYGDVIALLPYENYLEVLEVSGQKLIDVLNACSQFLPTENGDFPQVSGLRFTIDTKANPRVQDVQVLDTGTSTYQPINPNAIYTLATIDYCVTGGGLQKLLKNEKVVRQNIMLYNEALIEYITKHLGGHIGQEYALPQGRITIR